MVAVTFWLDHTPVVNHMVTAGFCRHAEHPLKFSGQFEAFKCLYQHDPGIFMPATQIIPCSVVDNRILQDSD